LPGSALYKEAVEKGYKLPSDYSGYSFHSYDTQPIPTDELKPSEILRFRDEAFNEYHTFPPFLDRVREKFGDSAVNNILEMTKVKLQRKLLQPDYKD